MPVEKQAPSSVKSGGVRRFLATVFSFALIGTGSIAASVPAMADTTPSDVCTAVNPMGAATPIGSEDGYTIFVSANAILANSELEGTLAVGGTATFGDSRGFQGGQYPIFHGGVGGNADYAVPTIGGEPNRVLIQKFAGTDKVVQVQARGASGDNALAGAKIGDQTTPAGYTFRQSFSGSGTTFFPLNGGNMSPQLDSAVQPWTNSVEAAAEDWGITGDVLSHFPADAGSSALSSFDDWQTVAAPAGDDQTIALSADGPSKLPLSAFAGISKFKLADYSETSFLVITVSPSDVAGGVVSLPSYSFAGKDPQHKEGISHILFDLSAINGEVKVVSPNEPVRGSIYAPNAHIVFPAESDGGREFEGQIIAKNFTALQGGKEMHTNLFKGRFPCSDEPLAATGTFNLQKVLSGVEAAAFPEGTTFPVTATWAGGEKTFALPADGTVVASELTLPEGTVVTFEEGVLPAAPAGYSFVSDELSAETITILAGDNANIAWSITNTYEADEVVVNDGTFNLRKILSGVDAAEFPAGTTFPVTATWVGGEKTFALPADGTVVASELTLPAGTVVTFEEGALPAAPAGYSFVSDELSAETITILAGDNANIAWSITNTYEADEVVVADGTFNLRKILSGVDAAEFPAGTTFPVTATWEGGSKTFALPADGTVVASDVTLAEGTVVTFEEGALPAAPEGYSFVSNELSADTITILAGDNENIAWSVSNTYAQNPAVATDGVFTLQKHLAGVDAGQFPDGTTFPVIATWEGGSKTFELPADGTIVAAEVTLPVGTVVTLTEGKLPAAPAGYSFVENDLSADTITIPADDSANIAWSVTNTYKADEVLVNDGTFNLSKVLVGVEAAAFPEGTTFPVTATWDGGEKTFALPADGTAVASDVTLPEGTVVTLTEGALPAAPAGYSFVSNELSADTITILAGDNENIAWSVTNTYAAQQQKVQLGGFDLAKTLKGVNASDFPSGTVFTVTATWTIDGTKTVREYALPVDGTVVAGPRDLPVGTKVTFSEINVPKLEGYTFKGVEFSPETITIEAGKTEQVEAVNTYEEGELAVTGAGAVTGMALTGALLMLAGGALMVYRRQRAA